MAIYHDRRTVQWGHWGITFMERQPDPTKNFGVIIGFIDFPVGTRGPMDGLKRDYYREICRAWVEQGIDPLTLRKVTETKSGCVPASLFQETARREQEREG